MGRSITYNVIGYGPKVSNGDGTLSQRIYPAMNKKEIAQEIEKAKRRGETIIEWAAQTKTGCKILGDELSEAWLVKTEAIKLPKLVECPICNGLGKKDLAPGFVRSCPVCSGSGITLPGYWDKWQTWQIDNFRAEFRDEGRN